MEWNAFCEAMRSEENCESDTFCTKIIFSDELAVGDRLRIAWQPDRVVVIRYLDNNLFVAEQCNNSTLQEGDTFRCASFYLGRELCMSNFRRC